MNDFCSLESDESESSAFDDSSFSIESERLTDSETDECMTLLEHRKKNQLQEDNSDTKSEQNIEIAPGSSYPKEIIAIDDSDSETDECMTLLEHKKKNQRQEDNSDTKSEKNIEISLGSRIAVYCSDDELFYEGLISSKAHKYNHVYVEYDDGEKDWVDLQNTKHCLISEKNANIPIGSRISVYWSDDEVFYDGRVSEQKKNGHHVHVEYDDGDKEWVNLQSTQHYILSNDVKLDCAKKKQSSKILDVSVGSRLSIWWPAEKEHFDGTVTDISTDKTSTKPYHIEYDDGDKEWVDLQKKKYYLISEKNGNVLLGSRISVYWSDDEVFYDGRVTKQKKDGNHVHVEYDDYGKEWVNLQSTQHYILSNDDYDKKKQSSQILDVSVGSRLSIWWPIEKEHFDGTVTDISTDKTSTKPHYIEYDDGDKEWINLNCRKFVLLHDH